ncbi:MAG: YlxR family protein [Turicibacter sp.]|nr:YlxR family protein [Turicibacter sp.]
MAERKIPMRKCVITGEKKPKQELIRIVREPETALVSVDKSGRKNGRGVYLHLSPEVVAKARKKNALGRHLEAEVPAAIYDELENLAIRAAEGLGR